MATSEEYVENVERRRRNRLFLLLAVLAVVAVVGVVAVPVAVFRGTDSSGEDQHINSNEPLSRQESLPEGPLSAYQQQQQETPTQTPNNIFVDQDDVLVYAEEALSFKPTSFFNDLFNGTESPGIGSNESTIDPTIENTLDPSSSLEGTSHAPSSGPTLGTLPPSPSPTTLPSSPNPTALSSTGNPTTLPTTLNPTTSLPTLLPPTVPKIQTQYHLLSTRV